MDAITQAHIAALSSPDLNRVEDAITALGDSGDPKAIAPLVRAFHRYSDRPQLKALICDALGELGDLRAVSALISHLRDDELIVRESAADALLVIGERCAHAMPDASDWESGFSDPSAALTQIAWQTDMEAVRLLLESLTDPQAEAEVKVSALYTLGLLRFIGALDPVKIALFDQDDEVSAAAAFALSELSREAPASLSLSIPEALYQAWHRDQSGHTRLSVEARVQVLRAAAECKVHQEQIQAGSLEERARQYIEALLSVALNDEDAVVRQLAVIGLGRLGDARALSLLIERLNDTSVSVRRQAAYAIGALGVDSSASALIDASAQQPSEVRVAVAWSLKRLDRAQARAALTAASESPSEAIRSVCAYLSGALGERQVIQRLISDQASEVRKSAALAVGTMKAYEFGPILLQLLNDPEWRVRTGSAEGLKRLQEPSAIPSLETRLASEQHSVARSSIQSAIRSLTSHLPT